MSFDNHTETAVEFAAEYYMDNVYESIYEEVQLKAMAWASFIPSVLSLTGSSTIIYFIFTHKQQKTLDVYSHLMLGMSSCDVVVALGQLCFGSWAIPKQAGKTTYGATGNFSTCTVSGFFLTCFSASILYTAFLSLYFVLKVVGGKKDRFTARYVEPFAHLIAVGWTLLTASLQAAYGELNPSQKLSGWCALTPYPPNCNKTEDLACSRGGKLSNIYMMISTSGLILLSLLTIIVCMTLLVWKVRQTERKMKNYGEGANFSMKMTKKTGNMALLYILSFFLCFIWYVVYSFLDFPATLEYNKQNFILTLGIKVFTPLQGFFNALVYLNPRREEIADEIKKIRSSFSSIRASMKMSTKRSKLLATSLESNQSVEPSSQFLDRKGGGVSTDDNIESNDEELSSKAENPPSAV